MTKLFVKLIEKPGALRRAFKILVISSKFWKCVANFTGIIFPP